MKKSLFKSISVLLAILIAVQVAPFSAFAVVEGPPEPSQSVAPALERTLLQTYGGSGTDKLVAIEPTKDGGYVAVLNTESKDGDHADANPAWIMTYSAIIKFDAAGEVVWKEYLGGDGIVQVNDVAVLADGSVVVVGDSMATNISSLDGELEDWEPSGQANALDAMIVKYSSNGNFQWIKAVKGSDSDMFASVAALSDGGFLVGGKSFSSDGNFAGLTENAISATLIRYTADGAGVWAKGFDGDKHSQIDDIAVADDGSIYAVCNTMSETLFFEDKAGHGAQDCVVLKLDENGNLFWTRSLYTSDYDYFPGIALAPDGGCVVGGTFGASDGAFAGITLSGQTDAALVKISEDGDVKWITSLGGTKIDAITDVAAVNGGYVAFGQTQSADHDFAEIKNKGGFDAFVAAFEENGSLADLSAIAGSDHEQALSVASGDGKSFIVAGGTLSADGDFEGIEPASANGKMIAYRVSYTVNTDALRPNDGEEESEDKESKNPDFYEPGVSEDAYPASPIIGEDESLRDQTSKYFRCEDGTYIAVQYGVPVHYNEDDEWKEYDNTLSLVPVDGTAGFYETADNPTDVFIPVSLSESDILVSNLEAMITFGVPDQEELDLTAEAQVVEVDELASNITDEIMPMKAGAAGDFETESGLFKKAKTVAEENMEKMAVKNLVSAVTYADLFPGADLEYIVMPGKIKENIVVKSPQDGYTYTFAMDLDGLVPVKQADGSIWIVNPEDETVPVFVIEAPYMYDADGNYSEVVDLSIENTGDAYTLTVTADADWINDESRAFPVVIDPTLEDTPTHENIEDVYADNRNALNMSWDRYLYVGNNYLGVTRSYVRFQLPDLPDCSVVTSSHLRLVQYEIDPGTGNPTAYINAYDLAGKAGWTEDSITWPTQPIPDAKNSLYGETILDYVKYYGGADDEYEWDITKAVKRWYETDGTNNGIVLVSSDENLSKRARFYSSDNAVIVNSGKPTIIVSYINNNGMESYWSYETASLGRSGDVCVNDYNGGLVYIHNDISMSGNRMPLSFDHVYTLDREHFSGTYLNMNFGVGFRLSLLEQIIAIPSGTKLYQNGYRYRYIDGDGTVHFFKQSSTAGVSEYEFDSNLKITANNDGTFTLGDDSGNRKTFAANGYLIAVTDANANEQQIIYDNAGTQITQVNDPVGRVVSFAYDDGYLTGITDAAGRTTSFVYDNGYLTTVTYPDGKKTEFSYSASDGLLLETIKAADGTSTVLDYKEVRSKTAVNYRVSSLESRGSDFVSTTTAPTKPSFEKVEKVVESYDDYDDMPFFVKLIVWILALFGIKININRTSTENIVTFVPVNPLYAINTAEKQAVDNRLTFVYNEGETVVSDLYGGVSYVMFDHAGRVAAVRDQDGRAVRTTFASSQNAANKPATQSNPHEAVDNLATDHSAELGGGWSGGTANGGSGSASISTAQQYIGQKSFQITSAGTTGIVSYEQNLTGVPSKTYTLSAYMKLPSALTPGAGANAGAYVAVKYKATSSAWATVRSGIAVQGDEWIRASATVTLPAGTSGEMVLILAIENASGTAYFDAVQLEEGSVANTYNLLENSSFDKSGGSPTGWEMVNCDGSDVPVVISGEDKGMKLTGDHAARKYVRQTVRVDAKAGDTLVFGAWVQAIASAQHSNRRFDVTLEYLNSSGVYVATNALFSKDVTQFQFQTGSVTLDTDSAIVRIYLTYCEEINEAVFNNAFINIDHYGTNYTYDMQGRLTRAVDNGQIIEYSHSGSDLTEVTTDQVTETLTYDQYHNLTQMVSSDGVTTTYTYPAGSHGNPTSVVTTKGGITDTLIYGYTPDYNYISSVTNAMGTTLYDYDTMTGVLRSTTDAKGNTTNYTYYPLTDELFSTSGSASPGVTAENRYTYVNEALQSIRSNGTLFSFEYDNLMRPTAVKVGWRELLRNEYNANSTLKKTTYGNGHTYEPKYDELDQVSSEWYNGSAVYSYRYTNNGALAYVNDLESGNTWNFNYNLSGGLTDMTGKNGERMRYAYGADGNVTGAVATKNNAILSNVEYGYANGKVNSVALKSMDNGSVAYNHDGMNRLADATHTMKSAMPNDKVRTNYTYLNNMELVSQIVTNKLYGGTVTSTFAKLDYTYDAVGNIETIRENNVLKATYVYDGLNQLVRENNVWLNQTIVYEYDAGGNIKKKTAYPYTTGAVSGAGTVVAYTYGDSNWRDLMTEYDSKSATYDAIGNLTKYDGYTFQWQKGRQLARMVGNGIDVRYKYNHEGLRTKKTVYTGMVGKTTEYFYAGDRLMSQSDGMYTMSWAYDASGQMLGFDCNGTKFYYIRNLQGDVIGIYDDQGNIWGWYVYDSWGQVTAVDDFGNEITNPNYITNINPIRYRGYYYDTETELYYLQSRYYNPEWGRFINADDVDVLNLAVGQLLVPNLFIYCRNNPIMYSDPSGYISIGAIVGGIIGFGVGALLMPMFADMLKLKGAGRTAFIAGGTVAVTALGALLGYYSGKALTALYAKGGVVASKLNQAIAKVISKFTGASIKAAQGNGWTLTLKKVTLRIMTSGSQSNYFRISILNKGALTIAGALSSNQALTHIPITIGNIIKIIGLILKHK